MGVGKRASRRMMLGCAKVEPFLGISVQNVAWQKAVMEMIMEKWTRMIAMIRR